MWTHCLGASRIASLKSLGKNFDKSSFTFGPANLSEDIFASNSAAASLTWTLLELQNKSRTYITAPGKHAFHLLVRFDLLDIKNQCFICNYIFFYYKPFANASFTILVELMSAYKVSNARS